MLIRQGPPLSATGLASGLSRQGEGPDPRQECKHDALTPHAHTLVSVGQKRGSVDLVDSFALHPNSVSSGDARVEPDRGRGAREVQ